MAQLDSIPQMLLPVMLTLTRGNPPVNKTVSLETTFENVVLDKANIQEYSAFCGFQNSADFPATWLYLLAQRAQIATMLDSKFPLAAPGIVHLTNSLEMFAKPSLDAPVTLKSSVVIEGKEKGSLFPMFTVEILQGSSKIALCKSGYIAKRGGGDKTEKSGDKAVSEPDFSAAKSAGSIVMPDSIGWDYAKVSGDFNPIHIAGIMAKAFGLPGKLAHGWYSVSMFASVIERVKSMSVKKIDVQFLKPVLLPTTVALEYLESGSPTAFRITSEDKRIVHLTGQVS